MLNEKTDLTEKYAGHTYHLEEYAPHTQQIWAWRVLGLGLGHALDFVSLGLNWAIRSHIIWAKNMFGLRVRPTIGIGLNLAN